jgi:hypothetical protein
MSREGRGHGRPEFAFCGHTHRARQSTFLGIRGFNVGGDYPFKRLLMLDWPAGTVVEKDFDARVETNSPR